MGRRVLRLALPAIITNITTPLLGLMDVAVTGHLGSPVYLAAIAVGGTLFNMAYWLMGFLRMGTSGLTAQAVGAGRPTGALLRQALRVALWASAAILLLQWPIARWGLPLMDVDEATLGPARTYFSILVWGAPAVLSVYAMTGWLLGMQDSKAGLWVSLAINTANIAVSLALVYLFGLGIRGVALGTLAAQWLGAAVAWHLCRRKLAARLPGGAGEREQEGEAVPAGRFLKVNGYIVARTLCLVGVTVWFTRVGAGQGAVMLAVNALLMQLFVLFSYFMDGFAFAGEALSGRARGAGDARGERAAVRALMLWGVAMALAFSALYFVGGEWALGLLSSEAAVVEAARDYLPWAVTVPLVGFAAFVWDGVFIGVTDTRGMLLAMALATAVYFALWLALGPALGNHALWLAFTAYLLVRSVAQTLLYRAPV